MAKETTVWIKPLDLPWEQVGTGLFQGITPENINLEADTWGPSNATFDLRREPDAPALDLSAGAEVEVHVAGVNVWDGFVSSTPKKRGDLVTSVVCRGWQDELDGRIFTAAYVHTSLTDFKDARSNVNTILGAAGGTFAAAGSVTTDGGGLSMLWPKSTAAAAYSKVGVVLDLGPNLLARTVCLDWTTSNNDSDFQFTFGGYEDVASMSTGSGTFEEPSTAAITVGASGQTAITFTGSTSYRYIGIKIQATTGHTPTDDVWLRLTGVRVFTDAAYASSYQSVLKASTVVSDALDRGTLALSSDRSGIDVTSFSIPDLWPDPKGVTARELISKVNAYHNWTAKLEPGRRFVFRARTTVPKVKVGEWSALPDDEDASSNDITDIYNHCRATSTEPGGRLVVVDRYSTQQASARPYTVSSPSADNPSLATNTTSWSTTAGTLTRDTTIFDTTPASLRLDQTGAGDDLITSSWVLTETMTGPFKAGIPYAVTVRIRSSLAFTITPELLALTIFSGTDTSRASFTTTPGTTWTSYTVNWTPRADHATASLKVTTGQGSTVWWFDTVTVAVIQPTILDRRARIRSQILDATAALPADGVALTQLADTWLAAHMTTPFKGDQSIQGAASVRDYLNGDNMAPERLLGMTTDLLHFDDRLNPDTGDVGRDGRLVKVTYQPSTDTVKTSVDNTRSDFNALLARIGVLAQS